MKRLLVVAADPDLTRFVAEAMLGRPFGNGAPQPKDGWEVSRAHSGLEATVLITRGGRAFDVIAFDQNLSDEGILEILEKVRSTPEGRGVPLYVLSERGRDLNMRRVAAEKYGVAGFIDKPVTPESLKTSLETLERRHRILLVDSDEVRINQYAEVLLGANFLVETAGSGRLAVDRAPRFGPDAILISLELDDIPGTDVCKAFKQSRAQGSIPILLFGKSEKLENALIEENAHRADDFLGSPFPDELLLQRLFTLIGQGTASFSVPQSSRNFDDAERTIQAKKGKPTEPLKDDEVPKPPPRSQSKAPPKTASPALEYHNKRSRRVPCHIEISVRDKSTSYTSKTLDISHGGILISMQKQIEVGTLIDMRFQFPNDKQVVNAVGKVVWSEEERPSLQTGYGVGVKFSKISKEDLERIITYVNKVSRVVYSPS